MMSPGDKARGAATILGLTALGMGIDPMMAPGMSRKPRIEPKPCVVCGQPHFNSNGCCSKECHAALKARSKVPVLTNRRKKPKSKRKK